MQLVPLHDGLVVDDINNIDEVDRNRLNISHRVNSYLLNPKSTAMVSWDAFIGMWLLYTVGSVGTFHHVILQSKHHQPVTACMVSL
jgi:hypothetical protein